MASRYSLNAAATCRSARHLGTLHLPATTGPYTSQVSPMIKSFTGVWGKD